MRSTWLSGIRRLSPIGSQPDEADVDVRIEELRVLDPMMMSCRRRGAGRPQQIPFTAQTMGL